MKNVPLITEHDTWVSLDPIIGCPASCAYCYLQPLDLVSRRPQVRMTPKELINKCIERFGVDGPRWGGPSKLPLPICIGNYTDMMMTPESIEYLIYYLALHADRFPEHPLCVVTKAKLKKNTLLKLDRVGHPVLVFLSQSFIKAKKELLKLEAGPTTRPSDTVNNARLLSGTNNLLPLHFWRPLSVHTVPNLDNAKGQLSILQKAGILASVAIGLKCGTKLVNNIKYLKNLYKGVDLPQSGQYLDRDLENRILKAGSELKYPVYRHTSCAIAFALRQHEALGTWRYPMRVTKCDPCSCPASQRALCDSIRFREIVPSEQILSRIASDLDLPRNLISWNSESGKIKIDAIVRQDILLKWMHLSGRIVCSTKIDQTLAWTGDFINEG